MCLLIVYSLRKLHSNDFTSVLINPTSNVEVRMNLILIYYVGGFIYIQLRVLYVHGSS
jgi:hypothetical protein